MAILAFFVVVISIIIIIAIVISIIIIVAVVILSSTYLIRHHGTENRCSHYATNGLHHDVGKALQETNLENRQGVNISTLEDILN